MAENFYKAIVSTILLFHLHYPLFNCDYIGNLISAIFVSLKNICYIRKMTPQSI